jgi:transmembrane sensor
MVSKETIEALYKRYLNNDISEEELEQFVQMLHTPEDELTVSSLMDGTWHEMFETKKSAVIPIYKLGWYRVVAAVIIILMLSAGGYFYFKNGNPQKQIAKTDTQEERFKNDIPPGNNNATLILSNGEKIILDSTISGRLARQGNVNVEKLGNGQITYNTTSGSNTALYNTLVNPRGAKPVYLQLVDGSKIWLNTESSLHYPTAFVGKERKVEITGEAYFEVAFNPAMPFKVSKGDAEVQVLGTHFNVNTYNNEDFIKVTLLEGSVKVKTTNDNGLLKPGQQARIRGDGTMEIIKDADIDEVMAWKNGQFIFRDASIETIMKQAARSYDADVVYEGKIPGRFVAEIPRDVQMSSLLHILELTDRVHFKIDGKKITVMP